MNNAIIKNRGAKGLPLHYLAWVAALMPFVTTHVSYLLAASFGHLDWCLPYGLDCYSISATGRTLPEKIWFKFGMIPAALVTMILWWSAADWRQQTANTAYKKSLATMWIVGLIAALFLILYTIALGEEGRMYRNIRRTGVILAFSLTFISQLLLTRLIGELAEIRDDSHLRLWHRRLMTIIVVLLATGLLSVVLTYALGDTYHRMENGFEWTMALMLNAYFVGLAMMWSGEKAVLKIVLDETGKR